MNRKIMENNGNLKFVGISILKFMGVAIDIALAMAIMIGLAYIDISNDGKIQDASYTENLQESLILLSSLIFMYLAKKLNRNGLFLVSGLFMCMFIREWDAVFDNLFHGAWKYFAIPSAVIFIWVGIKNGMEKAAVDLVLFIKSKPYKIIALGLLIVLVVSRLLGNKAIWLLMSAEHFQYVFKSFIEEGVELLGYMTIFVGSIYYYISSKKE